MKDVINIGLIGFGTVGSGAVAILLRNADNLAQKVASKLNIKRIVDLDITTPRPVEVPEGILSTNATDILDDPSIDIVVDTIGGMEPAGDFIRRALQNGKHVVTANKELIAKEGSTVLPLASDLGRDLLFEASVGGGIPIIGPLKSSLAANRISEIKGIVNGTTNYILSRMAAEGLDYSDVLPDAQAKGYAELDPTADVGGHDAAYKISILASIAFNSRMDVTRVHREGIEGISVVDLSYASKLGYAVKLLAIAKQEDNGVLLRVNPAFVPKSHPLANVNGVFNGIYIKGDAVGEVMFYGPGAGSMAAGSAVVGDIVDVARNINHNSTSRISCTCFDQRTMLSMDNVRCKNYVRVTTEDRSRVLASIAGVFADHHVSIESVMQTVLPESAAEIVWLTHEADEPNIVKALADIEGLPVVKSLGNRIRVEE